MAFSVSGMIDGQPAQVTLDAGELRGDATAIARVLELLSARETVSATPTGPSFTAALSPEAAALVTLVAAFDGSSEILVAGDVPELDADVPAGATP